MPSTSTFLPSSMAVFTSRGTSTKYSSRSGKSFASLAIRITRSELHGPEPEPVDLTFCAKKPTLSASMCLGSIIAHCGSIPTLPAAPRSTISFLKMSGLTKTPGPISKRQSGAVNALGNILSL